MHSIHCTPAHNARCSWKLQYLPAYSYFELYVGNRYIYIFNLLRETREHRLIIEVFELSTLS